MTTATLQLPGGCTLSQYALAKRLPIEFLRGLGLYDFHVAGKPVLGIPYLDPGGEIIARRLRLAPPGSDSGEMRFRWKKGNKPVPYGLGRLAAAREKGEVVLVEGESDAQTLWFHGIPALGIPGATMWKAEWSGHLDGIDGIYAVIEPGGGGEALEKALSASPIRDRLHLVKLSGFKDVSELHISNPDGFLDAWNAAAAAARPWRDLDAIETGERLRAATEQSDELAREPDLLKCFVEDLARSGIVGEPRAAKLLFLVLTSRFFDRPVSAAVKGTSSVGKSFLVRGVLKFFPASAYAAYTTMSERAIAYMEEPLAHRILVLFEGAGIQGQTGAYLVRSLLSEGQIRYQLAERGRDGFKGRLIEKDGPTGLITTTTRLHLDAELETRLLSIPTDDSPEQTRFVMAASAEEAWDAPDLTRWHALQEWLCGAEHRVTVPFSRGLAAAIEPVSVRLRRDFPLILALIKAHALLHQMSRQKDTNGKVVATNDDYAAVRLLVADLLDQGVEAAVSPTVRETVTAVVAISDATGQPATVAQVAHELQRDKSSAWRRVQAAIRFGFLKNGEENPHRPAKLELDQPMPEDASLLPTPESLAAADGCRVAVESPASVPPPPPEPPDPKLA